MKTNILKTISFLALIVALAAGSASAQAGRGVGRLGGIVVDLDNKPLEGVKLTLIFSENENLKYEVISNKKGEWSFIGLGTGNWNLTTAMSGFMPLTRSLYVSQLSVNPKVTVKLQKIAGASSGIVADEATFELLEKGNEAYKEKKFDEAMALYQQFFEKNPNLYQIQVSIADCWREKGEFDKAVEVYNKVIEQAKTDPALGKEMAAKSLAGIGNCYLKQNKLAEAQEFFQQSIQNSPNDEVLAYNVGEIFFANQGWDEALKYFDLASKIRPEWPDPYLKLGYVYLNKIDNPKAIENFDKFLKLEPEGERAAIARNILNVIKK